MFGRSPFTCFIFFLALLSPALADTYYRMTYVALTTLKRDGGFEANNPKGTGTVIEHAKNLLGNDDPYISTSTDYSFLRRSATYPGNSYVYQSIRRVLISLRLNKSSKILGSPTLIPRKRNGQRRAIYLGTTSSNGIHSPSRSTSIPPPEKNSMLATPKHVLFEHL